MGIIPGTNTVQSTMVLLVTQSVLTLVGGETSVVCNDKLRRVVESSRIEDVPSEASGPRL